MRLKPKLCCLSRVGQWWGGSASLSPANLTTEQHSHARPSSSSSTEEIPSLDILCPATHTFLLTGTPLQNITSNDIPLLQKVTNHSFSWDRGYPKPFSQALCGQNVFCWQPQGLSPLCWEEDGGRSQKPVKALAGSWQLTFLPRPTHTWVYFICCLWLFCLFFFPLDSPSVTSTKSYTSMWYLRIWTGRSQGRKKKKKNTTRYFKFCGKTSYRFCV